MCPKQINGIESQTWPANFLASYPTDMATNEVRTVTTKNPKFSVFSVRLKINLPITTKQMNVIVKTSQNRSSKIKLKSDFPYVHTVSWVLEGSTIFPRKTSLKHTAIYFPIPCAMEFSTLSFLHLGVSVTRDL